jgi:D-galacturonate reductase
MDVSFDFYPAEDVPSDKNAYITALDTMNRGDLVFIFTPDNLHFAMAKVLPLSR